MEQAAHGVHGDVQGRINVRRAGSYKYERLTGTCDLMYINTIHRVRSQRQTPDSNKRFKVKTVKTTQTNVRTAQKKTKKKNLLVATKYKGKLYRTENRAE